MAGTGSLSISASVTGLVSGGKTLGPITIASAPATDQSIGAITTVILASGANTITIPSNTCVAAVICFGAGSSVGKILKGVTGDTGITVSKVNPQVLTFDTSAPANFVITASTTDSVVTEIWYL